MKAIFNKIKPLLPSFVINLVEHAPMLNIIISGKNLTTSEMPGLFTFVLLQYNRAKLTIECIKNILLIEETIPVRIIVVDNGSTDGASSSINQFCASLPSVTVLETKENLGFARGNNFGYQYAREQNPNQLICVMNNDVVVIDTDFVQKIVRLYKNNLFSILGPDIIVPGKNTLHQNPFRYHLQSRDDKLDFIKNAEEKTLRIKNKSQVMETPSPNGRRIKDPYRRTGQIVLHGSVLIFSPLFISSFEEPFDSKTFLYGEEDILALRAIAAHQKIMYEPSLKVFHYTKSSTKKNDLERYYLFRYATSIKSAKRYNEILDEISKH